MLRNLKFEISRDENIVIPTVQSSDAEIPSAGDVASRNLDLDPTGSPDAAKVDFRPRHTQNARCDTTRLSHRVGNMRTSSGVRVEACGYEGLRLSPLHPSQ